MVVSAFPPVDHADDETGLLAIGGDLEVETLLLAYSSGIFPWPVVGLEELPWFAPKNRALLFLDEFHIPRTLKKTRHKESLIFACDRNFELTISKCVEYHKLKSGTWITNDMVNAYCALHKAGFAHSFECYRKNRHNKDELISALYGVSIGRMFAGESIFQSISNASKYTLWYLVHYLRAQNIEWIDCQQMSPLLAHSGARYVTRCEFMELLKKSISEPAIDFTCNVHSI